jgi:hypothetical protein
MGAIMSQICQKVIKTGLRPPMLENKTTAKLICRTVHSNKYLTTS